MTQLAGEGAHQTAVRREMPRRFPVEPSAVGTGVEWSKPARRAERRALIRGTSPTACSQPTCLPRCGRTTLRSRAATATLRPGVRAIVRPPSSSWMQIRPIRAGAGSSTLARNLQSTMPRTQRCSASTSAAATSWISHRSRAQTPRSSWASTACRGSSLGSPAPRPSPSCTCTMTTGATCLRTSDTTCPRARWTCTGPRASIGRRRVPTREAERRRSTSGMRPIRRRLCSMALCSTRVTPPRAARPRSTAPGGPGSTPTGPWSARSRC